MSADLLDEITSINSIYGDDTLLSLSQENATHFYSLTIPSLPSSSLRLEFPRDYPDAPPSIIGTQSVGDDIPKGAGTHIVDIIREILSEIYTPGAPVIFDLIEESSTKLSQLGLDTLATANEESQITPQGSDGQQQDFHQTIATFSDDHFQDELGPPPPWTISEIVTEKKSVFVARCAPVSSTEEAKTYLSHLLSTDKKVAKATHNITAWRILSEGGVQFQDCDDDGETAAGGRLLHLLELMGVWGCMVVVTRWYGGVQLGPDRFRLINSCGRDAVVKAGFAEGEKSGKDGGKKKKK